ncbi:unnamed protein product [Closterium sp. Naga37s-1]|nr:unnamed protein product [Closterium sp. Naga37s-1]
MPPPLLRSSALAHNRLLQLPVLRLAVTQALGWLVSNYWTRQAAMRAAGSEDGEERATHLALSLFPFVCFLASFPCPHPGSRVASEHLQALGWLVSNYWSRQAAMLAAGSEDAEGKFSSFRRLTVTTATAARVNANANAKRKFPASPKPAAAGDAAAAGGGVDAGAAADPAAATAAAAADSANAAAAADSAAAAAAADSAAAAAAATLAFAAASEPDDSILVGKHMQHPARQRKAQLRELRRCAERSMGDFAALLLRQLRRVVNAAYNADKGCQGGVGEERGALTGLGGGGGGGGGGGERGEDLEGLEEAVWEVLDHIRGLPAALLSHIVSELIAVVVRGGSRGVGGEGNEVWRGGEGVCEGMGGEGGQGRLEEGDWRDEEEWREIMQCLEWLLMEGELEEEEGEEGDGDGKKGGMEKAVQKVVVRRQWEGPGGKEGEKEEGEEEEEEEEEGEAEGEGEGEKKGHGHGDRMEWIGQEEDGLGRETPENGGEEKEEEEKEEEKAEEEDVEEEEEEEEDEEEEEEDEEEEEEGWEGEEDDMDFDLGGTDTPAHGTPSHGSSRAHGTPSHGSSRASRAHDTPSHGKWFPLPLLARCATRCLHALPSCPRLPHVLADVSLALADRMIPREGEEGNEEREGGEWEGKGEGKGGGGGGGSEAGRFGGGRSKGGGEGTNRSKGRGAAMSWRIRQLVRHGLVEWWEERGAAGLAGSAGYPALASGVVASIGAVTPGAVVTCGGGVVTTPGAFPAAWLAHSQRLREILVASGDELMASGALEGVWLTDSAPEMWGEQGLGLEGGPRSAEQGFETAEKSGIQNAKRGGEVAERQRGGRGKRRRRGKGGRAGAEAREGEGGERGTDGEAGGGITGGGEGRGEGGREEESEEEGAEVEEVEGTSFEEGTEKLLREMERELSTIEQVVRASTSTGRGGVVVARKGRADSGSDNKGDGKKRRKGGMGERIDTVNGKRKGERGKGEGGKRQKGGGTGGAGGKRRNVAEGQVQLTGCPVLWGPCRP